ncbi:hypothetical protein COY95_02980, partial [Candidatus Woesearchaeota archaeon CG_4_10_14_0_8_um_filter_47_5]
VATINITVNGSKNLSILYAGLRPVRIYQGGTLLAQFNYSFAVSTPLDLTNLTVRKNENNTFASLALNGITLPPGAKKTVYLDNITRARGVCIKDTDTYSVAQISANCGATDEAWVKCPGSLSGYTCAVNGTRFRITGLTHSVIRQMNDTAPPRITAHSPDGIVQDDDVFLHVYTNENATCYYAGTSGVAFINKTLLTGTGLDHTLQFNNLVGGTYHSYVQCRDFYNNTMATEYDASFTVSSGTTDDTESGGGGGLTPLSVKVGHRWNQITPLEPGIMAINNTNIAVSRLSLYVHLVVNDSDVTVEALPKKPSEVPILPEDVYQYLKITPQNIDDDDIEKVIINFRVPKSWITERRISQDTIILYRFVNDAWKELETGMLSSVGSYYTYEAESPGFSYFAISFTPDERARNNTPPEPLSNTTTNQTAPLSNTSIPLSNGTGTPNNTTRVVTFPKKNKPNYTPLLIGMGIFLFFGIGFAFFYFVLKKEPVFKSGMDEQIEEVHKEQEKMVYKIDKTHLPKKPKPSVFVFGSKPGTGSSYLDPQTRSQLEQFARTSLAQGHTKEQVEQELKDVGWHIQVIQDVLKKLK